MSARLKKPRDLSHPLGNARSRANGSPADRSSGSATELRPHRSGSRGNRANYIYAALTNVGRARDHNEDAVLAQPPLFVVADGLGGHDAGEVASTVAIEAMATNAPKRPDRQSLLKAAKLANQAVIDAVADGLGKQGMGTTLTAMVVGDGRVALAQVGDSRGYLFRAGRLSQVTEDHSIVAALVRSGTLTESEAAKHPSRNVITRALGSSDFAGADTYVFDTVRGDRWLLCSDGLTTMMPNEVIARILSEAATPSQAAEQLVLASNDAGGYDNITVVVVDIIDDFTPSSQTTESRRWWLGVLAWLGGAAIIVAAIGAGVYWYSMSKAYLCVEPDSSISVYRGVNGDVAGFTLASKVLDTNVKLEDLTVQDRARLCEGADYSSVDEAKDALEKMVDRSEATEDLSNSEPE